MRDPAPHTGVIAHHAQIDRVDPRFHDTEVLLLGNNLLTSVDGIEQFPRLSSLSLANNLVGWHRPPGIWRSRPL